jgi:hypothetical protein
MTTLTPQEQELMTLFTERLPKFIDDHPELEPQLYHALFKIFARKREPTSIHKDITQLREMMRQHEHASERA